MEIPTNQPVDRDGIDLFLVAQVLSPMHLEAWQAERFLRLALHRTLTLEDLKVSFDQRNRAELLATRISRLITYYYLFVFVLLASIYFLKEV